MGLANKYGLMGQYMRALGLKTKLMVKEDLFITMVIYMKENGLTIKQMDMVSIFTIMVQNIKDTGKMINSTERAMNHGQMEHSMMATTTKDLNKVKAN